MTCHPSHRKSYPIHKWAPFQGPWEEDTPGFEQFKLDVASPPEHKGPPNVTGGPDSEITCFRCRRDTYRVIDHRTEEEILAQLPDEQFRRGKGRGDPTAAENVLLLICPTCQHGMQMRESAVRRARDKSS